MTDHSPRDTSSAGLAGGSLPRRLQHFFERLGGERETILDRLGDVFTDDVHFRDPFRETHGLAELRTLFERALRQYRDFRCAGFTCTGTEDAFTLTYDMHMRMAVGPGFVTPMASICVARGGKVAEMADYYDFVSGLASPLRLVGLAYRNLVNRLFL